MLNKPHFYHRTIRRNVITFGTIFKDIELVRYSKDTTTELDRITVPLTYAGKENFLTRLLANPDLHNATQITLPRMSFEMVDIAYDSTRKLSSFVSTYARDAALNSNILQQRAGVPYDLTFELNIYVRNVEDGTQIVEQILPFFNPDYTLSMTFVDDTDTTAEVPLILENVQYSNSYAGEEETVRILIWTLTFKMKTYFFGPTSTKRLIRKSNTNTNIFTGGVGQIVTMYMDTSGSGDYKLREPVYQGENLQIASGIGKVQSWNPLSKMLQIEVVSGNFSNTTPIIGAETRTKYSIEQYDLNSQMVTVSVLPDPTTANVDSDFGFTTSIQEYYPE